MATATSEAMQVPLDLPAMTALGALSAAVAGRAEVVIRPGWREPLSLFVAVAADSSERDGAVHRLITAPLHSAELHLRELAEPTRGRAALEKERAEATATKARALAIEKSKDADALVNALDAEAIVRAIDVPPPPRLLAGGDATPEAIAQLLVRHGRIAILDTEGALFEMLAGRHSNGVKQLDTVLKAYSGDRIAVERRGRDTEFVDRPALALVLAVQPLVLARVVRDPDMTGRGLAARFLIALPAPCVGRRLTGHAVPLIPSQVQDAFDTELKALAVGMDAWEDPAMVPFTKEGLDELYGFEAQIEVRLGRTGDLRPTGAWGGKLVGQIVRVCGLLHLAGNGPEKGPRTPIDRETVRAALRVADFIIAHALAAFVSPTGNGESSAAAEALTKIRLLDAPEFTTRELQRKLRSAAFPDVQSVRAALDALEDLGWIVRLDVAGHRWACHPKLTGIQDGPT